MATESAVDFDVFLTSGVATMPPSLQRTKVTLFSVDQAARLARMDVAAPLLYGTNTPDSVSSDAVREEVRKQLASLQAVHRAQLEALVQENTRLRGSGIGSLGVENWFRGLFG